MDNIGSIYMILAKEGVPSEQRERIIKAIMQLRKAKNDD